MLQRIQTIFLVVVAVICLLFYFFPFSQLSVDNKVVEFSIYKIRELSTGKIYGHTLPMSVLNFVIFCGTMISIFLFKNRKLQLKLVVANIIFVVLFCAAIFLYPQFILDNQSLIKISFYSYLPALQLIMLVLAYRRIKKDEELIKSVDRIR